MKKLAHIFGVLFLFIAHQATAQLEQQALAKITELDNLIDVAEQQGIDVRKEKMTVRTAEVFMDFAAWDEANQTENTSFFDQVPIYRDSAEAMAAFLPAFERQEVILMLDTAIDFLQKLIDGTYKRKQIPSVNWTLTNHENDQLTYNDRPVFLEDYTWKPHIPQLTQYFGDLDGFFITPGNVVDENGTINNNVLNNLNTKPSGSMGFIFINNQNVPDWALSKYGEDFVYRPEDNFTDYDIDHPGAKEMMGYLIDGTVPQMASKKYTQLGYMLCNEPHFFTKQGVWATGTVSEYTIDKFKTWLGEQHANIAALNTAWNSSFNDFDEVEITLPISGSLQGTPIWYDWCLFNMDRVTDWYQWMKERVLANDVNAKVHLKIMPRMWAENLRDHGIDLEALTELSEIIGNDAQSYTNHMWGGTEWWEEKYAFNWREMTMSYDFMKSVSPKKIIFNSESHYLSTNRARDLYQKASYARATYWMAHTLGLNATQTWYWAREADGSIRNGAGKGYAGSNNHQPRIVNEVHATLMDLNSYSEEITAMQRQRKPLRIFHSKTSAINKPEHMDDVFELYESLFFDGVPIGFATENIIEQQNNDDWDAILIYKTEFVTQDERNALQSYLDNGGTIIMDDVSLATNEYGQALSALTQGNGTLKRVSSLAEIGSEGMTVVENNGLLPVFIINETNDNGSSTCHWKAIINEDGNPVLSVVNLGNMEATLDIQLRNDPGSLLYKNLLNGVVLPKTVVLAPNELLFVEAVDSTSLAQPEVVNILYPNPTTGLFNINFDAEQANVEMQVFDITGRLILKKTFTNINQISDNIHGEPAGSYVISLKAGEEQQRFILIKG